MKFSPVAAIFLAALANAQSRSDIPSCALTCLDDAVKQNTKCSTDDYACVCKSMDTIQGSAAPCVLKACGQDVALTKVLPAAKALCKQTSSGGGSGGQSSAAASSAHASSAPASSALASSAPASSAASSAAASSQQPQQSSAAGHPTQSAQPTKAPHTTGAGAGHASSECSTAVVPTGKPSTNGTVPTGPVVTAGAAALAPVGGLTMFGLGALLL